MTGEELFNEQARDVLFLGPRESQADDIQRAWKDLARGVTEVAAMRHWAQEQGLPPHGDQPPSTSV